MIHIRNITEQDYDFVLQTNLDNVEVLSPMSRERMLYLKPLCELFLIAEVEGRPAAFLMALREGTTEYDSENYRWFAQHYEKFLYVDRIVIGEPYRHLGIGRKLYETVFDHARKIGAPVVTCEVDTIPYNAVSLSFHKEMGFHEVGTQHVELNDVTVSLQERPIVLNPVLETERLTLRPWHEEDAEVLYKYASDPEVGPCAGWPPHQSVEESREIIKGIFSGEGMWAVEWKVSHEPIGCVGYLLAACSNLPIAEDQCEVGYWIARPYWGQGICTEAMRAVVDYCFKEKGFSALWGGYFPTNPASGRVMEKCGFTDTGRETLCPDLEVGGDQPVKIMFFPSFCKIPNS